MAVRAPELTGAWVCGGPLALADLRGHVVLIDFWTSSCINCIRVAEELRELERRYAGVLVVVGVHSPKFPHERDAAVVRDAAARLRLEHPVLSDPERALADAYAVRAWPTLVLVDPQGREAARFTGEGHVEEIAAAVERLAASPAADAGSRAPARSADQAGAGELSFPGKVRVAPDGRTLAVADTGHDRVVVCDLDGRVHRIHDGLLAPQGIAWTADGALLVCDQAAGRVVRIAADDDREVLVEGLASPWDVVLWHGHVTIAEAGRHRIRMLDADGEAQVVAGAGEENLLDGPALGALLAQPSGLAVTRRGELAFVDAESSALRVLDRPGGTVRTVVGTGLFAWGDRDGDAAAAQLQHPLGVAVAPDGALYLADTFNDLIRVARGDHLWTVPTEGFAEPGGLDVLPDGRLIVADTANHRLVLVDPVDGGAEALGLGLAEPVVLEAGGALLTTLDVPLAGEQLDVAGGAAVEVTAWATADGVLAGPTSWTFDALPAHVEVPLGDASGRVVLELRAATCTPRACHLRRAQRAFDVVLR